MSKEANVSAMMLLIGQLIFSIFLIISNSEYINIINVMFLCTIFIIGALGRIEDKLERLDK